MVIYCGTIASAFAAIIAAIGRPTITRRVCRPASFLDARAPTFIVASVSAFHAFTAGFWAHLIGFCAILIRNASFSFAAALVLERGDVNFCEVVSSEKREKDTRKNCNLHRLDLTFNWPMHVKRQLYNGTLDLSSTRLKRRIDQ